MQKSLVNLSYICKCWLLGAYECIFALLVVNSCKWMRIFSQWTAKGAIVALHLSRESPLDIYHWRCWWIFLAYQERFFLLQSIRRTLLMSHNFQSPSIFVVGHVSHPVLLVALWENVCKIGLHISAVSRSHARPTYGCQSGYWIAWSTFDSFEWIIKIDLANCY